MSHAQKILDIACEQDPAKRKRMADALAPILEAKLTTKKRNAMRTTTFALPSERKYPIPDLSHARNALARSAGKPEEATVRAAVYKKFPELKHSK